MFIVEAHRDLVSIPDELVIVKIDKDWIVSFVLVGGMHFDL
jgi:hypothetical protein